MSNEDRLIDVLERIDKRLARLESLLLDERKFGGMRFSEGVTRIIYGVE